MNQIKLLKIKKNTLNEIYSRLDTTNISELDTVREIIMKCGGKKQMNIECGRTSRHPTSIHVTGGLKGGGIEKKSTKTINPQI